MRDAREAEVIRIYREKWAKGLYKTAYVYMLIWGVIIHNVNMRSLGINKALDTL